MTKKQKLLLEQSEKRQKINDLLALDELTDEQRSELDALTQRMQEMEPELRAAIVVEGEEEQRTRDLFDDPESRELARLESRASLGGIFSAAIEHRQTDGETAELQQHLALSANQIPLALLREPVETRAVTPAPANVGQTQSAIIPGVFPRSVAAFLDVDMPTVGVGEAVFPVLATNATVHAPGEGASAADTTGSFTADVLSPARLQAAFFYSREDRARFVGMDEALRMNLADALSDALDRQVVSGTNGLLTGTNLANHAVNAVTTYGTYRSGLVYDRIDGTYAAMASDIRVVMGSATYGHAASQYRGNATPDNALDVLERDTSGVRVSAHVPAASSNKQNAVVRRGSRRDMVAPVWEGVTLIPDEVTKASTGEIVVTAVMLHAVKILRPAGFYKQETQHA